jgi:hypothetical protein
MIVPRYSHLVSSDYYLLASMESMSVDSIRIVSHCGHEWPPVCFFQHDSTLVRRTHQQAQSEKHTNSWNGLSMIDNKKLQVVDTNMKKKSSGKL